MKIMTDGVLENYTGALLEPYCDGCGGHTDNHGLSYVDRDVLAAAVTELDRARLPGAHARDRRPRGAQRARRRRGRARARTARTTGGTTSPTCRSCSPTTCRASRALGVVANCQTLLGAEPDPQMEELTVPFLGDDRVRHPVPVRGRSARAGARLAMGSDWSVTTADPLAQLEVAVTRAEPRHGAPFLPEQRLPLDDAVDAFTARIGVRQPRRRRAARSRSGTRADLAVLDLDVFADGFVSPGRAPLADASVELTVASGRVVHDRLA